MEARRFVHDELLSIDGWMRVCRQLVTTRVEYHTAPKAIPPRGSSHWGSIQTTTGGRARPCRVASRITLLLEYRGKAGPSEVHAGGRKTFVIEDASAVRDGKRHHHDVAALHRANTGADGFDDAECMTVARIV